MRSRRATWIAGGVVALALALGVVVLSPKKGQVTVHAIGQTNDCCRILVTNGTAQLHYVTFWAEFYRNDDWERLSLTNATHRLEPGSFVDADIPLPANNPRRVVFVWKAVPTSGLPKWIDVARVYLRMKPKVERAYIEIE